MAGWNAYGPGMTGVWQAYGRRFACISALLSCLAAPAQSGTFTAPEGCEGWLTVQSRGCRVSNHYRCEAGRPGDTWRMDFGINGAFYRGRIDDETQWMESHHSDGAVEILLTPARDPAQFSELLATGLDSYDFSMQRSTGVRKIVRGYDRLTGEAVVIDSITLKRTKFEARAVDDNGQLIWDARGHEYIHPEWRVFFGGTGQTDLGEGWLPKDFSPVEFIFPGEEGFFDTIPKFDCDAVLAKASLP